ncbi:MAG: PAS domain S-box protein [gamma proteobacterium endosymbiont of Lamellibrachia anaximandri]|nr:PAS domain S-box protein [gamma proteobacterium endosymbiont of Lamellibrachia anaximandri]MBL3616197.1 PAS domain S-box protein [gamma proteobacterium endosymbiont of Lamellibrachia anaximandri]
MIKVPFYRRLDFRIVALFSAVLFFGLLVGLFGARYVAEQDFRELLIRQFQTAGNMAENSFTQIGQMGLNGANHFLLHPDLHAAIDVKDSASITTEMDALAKETSADIAVLLDSHGRVIYHSEDPLQLGKSRMSHLIVREAILDGEVGTSILQELDNFIIYSSGRLLSDIDKGHLKAVILVGYAINDPLINNLSKDAGVGLSMVRRRAIMASTFNREDRRLKTIPMQWTDYQSMLQRPDSISKLLYNDISYFTYARRLKLMDPIQEGSILFTIPARQLDKIQDELLHEFELLFALLFFLIALFGWRFSQQLLEPLHRLFLFTNESPEQQNEEPLKIKTNDEVGALAYHFNDLINDIKKKNRELESRVEERTRELQNAKEVAEKANRSLQKAQAQLEQRVEQRTSELKQSEERTRAIIDSAADGIIVIDGKGIVEIFSPSAEILFGYDASEVIGNNINMLMPEPMRSKHDSYLARYLPGRESRVISGRVEIKGLRQDGDAFPMELSVSELLVGNKQMFVGIMRDTTERKQAEQAMAEAKEAAEASAQAKSDFLANMSHEIRTPMNAIIGMSKLALGTDLNPKQHNFIRKVHYSAELLLGIINDVLNISKIEAGKLEIEKVNFQLQSVLDNVSNLIGIEEAEQNLELILEVADDIPDELIGDPLRLGQILINLGNNAVKFTQQGRISISAKLENQKDKQLTLHFCVSDTGIGITPEHQQKLFQSFSQADSSTSRRYGGTGLGLTISKRLTELMGGKIWVVSQPDKGSDFHFTVQLEAGDPEQHKETDLDTKNKQIDDFSGIRVLLVEDNEINQELAKELLSDRGFIITSVWNGKEAVEILQKEHFDGVLMDIQMPVMDGYTATRIIRNQVKFKELPIIAMTANIMESDRAKAKAAGMDDHIGKPLDVNELFTVLAKWISPNKPQKVEISSAKKEYKTSYPFHKLTGIDIDKGLEIARNRPEFFIKLLTMFRDSQHGFLNDFLMEQQSDDPNGAVRAAHSLKGSAANIGATTLRDAAQELEMACNEHNSDDEISEVLKKVTTELDPLIAGLNNFLNHS